MSIMVILGVLLILAVLYVVKLKFPNSTVAQDETKFMAWIDGEFMLFKTKAEAAAAVAKQEAARVVKAAPAELSALQQYVGDQFDNVLAEAETSLMDTKAEDADIADGTHKIARANASKAQRLARAQAHIAKLQAHVDSMKSGS